MKKSLRASRAMALVVAPPAAALAAKPVAGAVYTQTAKDKTFIVNPHVAANGQKIDNFNAFKSGCTKVPFNPPLTMKIQKSGTFSLNGNRKDINGKTLQVVISGKFVKPNEAKGFYKVSGKGCKGKKVNFDAKQG